MGRLAFAGIPEFQPPSLHGVGNQQAGLNVQVHVAGANIRRGG